MEKTVPVVRFVRCPKCLKILTEFAEIPVYKCGGCGVILRTKACPSSERKLNCVSVIPESHNLPDSDPSSNGSESSREQIPTSEQEGANNLNVLGSNGDIICEKNSLKNEHNEIKKLNVSDFNGDVQEVKMELSGGLEETCNGERSEEGNEMEISSNVNNPEAYDTLKSSNKVEASSGEDLIDMGFGNANHVSNSRSSSHAYEGSVSSTDEDRKDHLRLSRRTFRNKNALNSTSNTNTGENFARRFLAEKLHSDRSSKPSLIHDVPAIEQESLFTSQVHRNSIESENDVLTNSPENNREYKINHRFSEQDDRVKILSRVDELRNEFKGLFDETANNKESSQIQRKFPSPEYASSIFPFTRQSSSSYYQSCSGNQFCHNEHCRPCPHNVCCHQTSSSINQGTQNVRLKLPRSQTIIRLCRPVSGGAPFVICYKCFELLQLPMDFLIWPKRLNKIRCGACSQLLTFYFRPKSRSMTQTPVEVRHPPSEENGAFNVAADDENLVSQYRNSSSGTHSTEVESALLESRSFDEGVEVEEGESGCFVGSRLHDLMGYYSASELLFSNDCSPYRYQSMESEASKICRPGRKRWEMH